jgi:hypothetical protein
MDKRYRSDPALGMPHASARLAIPLAALAFAALAACSGSPPKATDASEVPTTPDPSASPDPASTGKPDDEGPVTHEMGSVKRPEGSQDVPDDYSLTESDCDALGKEYGDAARGDQKATLSAKLNEKQRSTALENIDAAVSKLESTWIDNCMKSLAGKVVDHGNIKCALAAKTVKAFDICLNGEKGSGPAAGPKKK